MKHIIFLFLLVLMAIQSSECVIRFNQQYLIISFVRFNLQKIEGNSYNTGFFDSPQITFLFSKLIP